MGAPYGQTAELGICFQNSYGTANVSSMHWMAILSEDVTHKAETLQSQNMRGVFEEGDAYQGRLSADGTIEMEAHPISLGVMLTAIFGAPTTVTSGGIYTHTWKPSQTDWDELSAGIPFTFHKNMKDGGSASLVYDLCGNELELSVANGEFLTSRLGVVGGNFKFQAPSTASYPAGKRWTWDVTSVSMGNSSQTGLNDLSIKVNESLEGMHSLAVSRGKWPARVKHSGFRMVEISGTMRLDNQNEFKEYIEATERELVVSMKGPTEIQSGFYETLTVKVPAMRYTEYPLGAGGPGLIEVGFSAKGNYSQDSGTAVQFTLVNTKAAYV